MFIKIIYTLAEKKITKLICHIYTTVQSSIRYKSQIVLLVCVFKIIYPREDLSSRSRREN